jgi:hypothetical protein
MKRYPGTFQRRTMATCREDCDCAMCGTRRWSMKLYDSFEPVRQAIDKYPELRAPVVAMLAEAGREMTDSFAGNFYGRSKH